VRSIALLTVLGALAFARSGGAQTYVGGRAGAYLADEDPFVGGEVLVGVEEDLYFNPNVDFVFADRANKSTFNFDFHYDFARRGRAFFWIGAGLALIYVDPDGPVDSTTDAGANVLFGVGFRSSGSVIPYVQAKLIAADDSDFVLGFGIRF
jgi:hypothetical protein